MSLTGSIGSKLFVVLSVSNFWDNFGNSTPFELSSNDLLLIQKHSLVFTNDEQYIYKY